MTCPELEKRLQDIEYHRKELNYFLLRKELHLLADAKAKQSATTVASALARASNQLHWHQNQCSICKQSEVSGVTQ
jgi:hypothetical protein